MVSNGALVVITIIGRAVAIIVVTEPFATFVACLIDVVGEVVTIANGVVSAIDGIVIAIAVSFIIIVVITINGDSG